MIYILIFIGISGMWIFIESITAPKGYEDSEGFFLNRPNESSEEGISEEKEN